jgi:hypothetical protein
MTLSDIKNHIFRRTKTNATSYPAADMVISINNAIERVESIIRTWISNYDATRITSSDLSTGTLVPKFNSRFHELLALWPEYQYASDDGLKNTNNLLAEIQVKEDELKRFYGLRNYKIVSITIATPGVITLDNHKLLSGDRIILETTGALPTGLSAETWYYVISDGLTTREFRISATKDGSSINTSGSQSGTHFLSVERQRGLRAFSEDNR